jgi:hypothetical protein
MAGTDIIGDIHGNLAPLRRLLENLGYREAWAFRHPQGRRLVFLGDLIDRGPASLEVAELVMDLCRRGRALCLTGNHEYNLVRWRRGLGPPKHSNRPTIAHIEAEPARWEPVLAWMATLPLSLRLPFARVLHAVWHPACADALREPLGSWPGEEPVELGSPFAPRAPLPREPLTLGDDLPHEILIKGYERRVATPFLDNDGKSRDAIRVTWWSEEDWAQPRTIFGHYWNVPPVPGEHEAFAPRFASGHPDLRDWQTRLADLVPDDGRAAVGRAKRVCVDYNGVTLVSERACVGAYRWPENEVAWACAPKALVTV